LPARRLERHPLTPIEHGPSVTFYRNGRPIQGFANEPLAVAEYAANQRVLSRSMRYHRARGLFCGTGNCTSCFQSLNGVPNVRTCVEPCEELDWVEDQNSIPDAETDLLAAADLAFPNYLDAHTSFIRPAFLKPVFTKVIRGMAGFGKVPKTPIEQTYRAETAETDICIVGAGVAGLAAAEAAASTGLHVLLIEREAHLGGRLNRLPRPFDATSNDAPRMEGKAWALLAKTKLKHAGVTSRVHTRLFGIYDEKRLACATHSGLLDVRARALVLAPGAYDGYAPFPGADRAGVMLAGAALRLLNEYAVTPGDEVAIVGATRQGLQLARDLHACGVRVSGIVDSGPEPPRGAPLVEEVHALGIPFFWNHRPLRVSGRTGPRALVIEGPSRRSIRCETVVLATARHPSVELFQQAGCKLLHTPELGGFRPQVDDAMQTSIEHVFAAGSAAGVTDEWGSVLSGRLAGHGALHSLSLLADDKPLEQAKEAWRAYRLRARAPPRMVNA
jgi:sarcosine oxidase, subunit alpha